MTAFLKKVLLTILGLAGALFAWAALELLLGFGERLGGYLVLSVAQGVIVGGAMGFFFGTSEGILLSEKKRALKGGLTGFLIGMAGGVVAVLLAQSVLYLLGNSDLFSRGVAGRIVTPAGRALGWVFLGMIIGAVDGIRAGSLRRIGIGISGGFVGGLLGGAALELLVLYLADSVAARFAGLLLLGASIGLFYSLFEHARAYGILKVLTGPIRGKEYVISMRKTRLGSSPASGLVLEGYAGVEKNHAELSAGKEGLLLVVKDGPVLVNDDKVSGKTELKYEDVIQLGSARLYYLPR
jgi:hypothetical protein